MAIDFKAIMAARKAAQLAAPDADPMEQEQAAIAAVSETHPEEVKPRAATPAASTAAVRARAKAKPSNPTPASITDSPRDTTGLSRGLADSGFEIYHSVPITRLMAVNSGQEKHGKTEWAFSAPAPLAVISFDAGTLRIVNKHAGRGRRIIPCFLKVERGLGKSDAQKEWDKFQRAVDAVMEDTSIRSLVVDTGTEMWDLLRLAKFGKLTQVMPHHYVEANAAMREFVKGIYDSRLDLITVFPHKVKKEYKSDKKGEKDSWTGKYEFAGWGDFGFQADIIIRNFRDDEADDGEPFKVHVKDCGPEAALNNMILSGDEAKLPYLASMMFPEIDSAAWEDQ
jgi:hypothetical protein